jgi:hypothetical protein
MRHFDLKAENRQQGTERGRACLHTLFLFFAFCFLLSSRPLFSQPKADFLAVDSAFVNQQYEKAELLALRIIQGQPSLTNDERARLNLTMGYCATMLGREDDARLYFSRALDAVPDLQLDPVQVSPKFRVIFDEVKSGRATVREQEDARLSQVKSVRIARFTNLIVPGTGQWQQGYRTRGAIVFGLQAASVAMLIWRWGKMNDTRESYLAETNRSLVQSDYDRYNRDYRLTWAAGLATGFVYLASQADLIWLKPTPKSLHVALIPSVSSASMVVHW